MTGYADAGEAAGATLVVDGRRISPDADGAGFFVGPTLFDHVRTDMSIYTDEIFGRPPVPERGRGRHGRDQRAGAGAGADGLLLLRRLKSSLVGDTHAHGTEGVHFFTRGKVITSRWLDPSHGGINLGFPQNV